MNSLQPKTRRWIADMRKLLAAKPDEIELTGMGTTLFALGPEALAIIGDKDPVSTNAQFSDDWIEIGPLRDSGGF